MRINIDIDPAELIAIYHALQEGKTIFVAQVARPKLETKDDEIEKADTKGGEDLNGTTEQPQKPTDDEQPTAEQSPANNEEGKRQKGNHSSAARTPKPVDIRREGEAEWMTFPSISAAAKEIGCYCIGLSKALMSGKNIKGFEVRYNNDKLDEVLEEIEKKGKEPYQISKPIR